MALGVEVDFTANVARFSSQVDRISSDLDRFRNRAESMASRVKNIFTGLGVGLTVGGLGAFLKAGIDDLDRFNDLSDRTGIAIETLSGLSGALKLADTDMESFLQASNRLSVNIGNNAEEFKKLGITAKDPAEAFLQLADAFSSIEDPQQRAALGAKALGKSYAEMAPLLLQGGDAVRAQITEFQKASGVTTELAQQAGEFNDAIDKLTFSLSALKVRAVGPLLGPLTSLVDYFSKGSDSADDLADSADNVSNSFFSLKGIFENVALFVGEVSEKFEIAAIGAQALAQKIGAIATLNFPKLSLIDDNYERQVQKARSDLDGLYQRVASGNKNAKIEIGTAETGRKLITLNDQINQTLSKIDALEKGGIKGAAVSFFGGNLDEENKKLDSQLKERSSLLEKYNADVKRLSSQEEIKTGVNVQGIEDAGDKIEAVNRKIGGSVRSASRQVADSVDQITEKYNQMAADLQREIDLSGETREAARIQYETVNGSLQNLTQSQKDYLITLAQEKELIEAQNNAYQEKQDYINSLIEEFNQAEVSFERSLARVQDALNEGIIDEARAKAEFDKLGQAYNDSFIDPAKQATDELSPYAEQAARNIQDAFANFLFDPFGSSLEDMVNNFADAIRRMAANAISSQLLGNDGWLSQLFGSGSTAASAASSTSSASSSGGFWEWLVGLFAAKGYAFDQGNIIPFANGGVIQNGVHAFAAGDIFSSPAFFSMADNQVGMLGEAGPEAIMPLSRGSDGKLGVKVNGGNSSRYNIVVNVGGGSVPDVRRAAAQGAREALGLFSNARRYG